MSAFWRWAADVMVVLHYAFLAYVLIGGFVAWRWPRTIVTHALAVVWAALIVFTSVACPLTALQNNFRERAGQGPLVGGGFIDLYVKGTFYPAGAEHVAQGLLALVVLASWFGFARRGRSGQRGRITFPRPLAHRT